MKYREHQGWKISTFSLGTVQLGLNYGISNTRGKPSLEQAFAILDRAVELGVNLLDTANDYGDSERTIGAWLSHRRGLEQPKVATKIGHLCFDSEQVLEQDIRSQIYGCMERLNLSKIPVLMLHNFEEYARKPQWIRQIFQKLKDEDIIERSGVSAYSHHDYGVAAQSGFDCIQVPLNIFDWRRIKDGSLERLSQGGVAVFVRSVFLQGLVFRDPEQLEPEMAWCRPVLSQFRTLCQEFGMRPEELAVSFLLTLPQISGLVLGCETVEQVEANANLVNSARKLTAGQMAEIERAFLNTDPRVLNPSCWRNAVGSVPAK